MPRSVDDPWASQRFAVRAAMRDQGLTQVEVASKLGISPKHLNQMLTGAMDGGLRLWVELANALGMTWGLVPMDPVEHTVEWVRNHLGIQIEPWQAAQLRAELAP